MAWLSTSTVNAVDRLTPGSGPFVRASDPSTVIAADIADLTDGSIVNPIFLDETGSMPPLSPTSTRIAFAFTGTLPDGSFGQRNMQSGTDKISCLDWTSDNTNHTAGIAAVDAKSELWTAGGDGRCASVSGILAFRTIYCFEAPVAMPTASLGWLMLLTLLLVAAGVSLLYRRNYIAR